MATEILMPRQGQSVESCIIVEWKKQEGDRVTTGEPICEVETDKATFEVESPADGVLLKRLYSDGDEVPVLERIAFVGSEGEALDKAAAEASGGAAGPETETAAAPEEEARPAMTVEADQAAAGAAISRQETPAATAGEGGRRVFISPRARERAQRSGVPVEQLSGTGPGGRIIERDIDAALVSGQVATRAAAAQGRAADASATAVGTGIGGRVTTTDRAAQAGPVHEAGATAASAAAGGDRARRAAASARDRSTAEQKLTGVRKRIAERMLGSVQGSAQLTLHSSADARALQVYRRRLKDAGVPFAGITVNDLVLYAVSRVLPNHLSLNATLEGEDLRTHGAVHLGMAVDTPRGLMVPVIRDADLLSLALISSEAQRLAAACRDGRINPDELSGGSFSITNLGSLGIEVFTPVLNPPQVAILGVCSIQPKPVFSAEGDVEHIPSIGLSLTIDHRVVDGVPAARFLHELGESLKSFELLLSDAGSVGRRTECEQRV